MSYTIGRIARLADVSVATIRYYERRSLLAAAPRTDAGYRVYPPGAVERIRFIKQAQTLGLSLAEIKDLLAGFHANDAPECRRVHELLARHLGDLDARMNALQELRSILAGHVEACARTITAGRGELCPTVNALEGRRR